MGGGIRWRGWERASWNSRAVHIPAGFGRGGKRPGSLINVRVPGEGGGVLADLIFPSGTVYLDVEFIA